MSGKRPPPRQQTSNTHQHPAVQGALASLKKAKGIMQKDPAIAATVMWNIAKDIAEHGDDTTTRSALEGALDCMERMNADKALRGTKGAPASWTARTLLKTMLDCRMALARLEPATGRAGAMYLDALGEFLGIESKALHGLAQSRDPVSLDTVASKLNESIPRKFGNTEDVGQAVSTIEEVASGLLSFSGGQHEDPAIWTGVALYFLLHSFATTKGAPDTAYRAVLTAGEAFKALGLEYLQCDCALVLIDKHWQQNAAKFTAAQAITRSLEMGDLVRAQSILNKTKERWSDPWIQYLAKVVTRSVDSDALWLEFDARDEWTHVCSDSQPKNLGSLTKTERQQRPNYFLAARLSNPSLQTQLQHFYKSVSETFPEHSQYLTNPTLSHVTLGTMFLEKHDIPGAVELLESFADLVNEYIQEPPRLTLKGIGNFGGNRVVFANVNASHGLQSLVRDIRVIFWSHGYSNTPLLAPRRVPYFGNDIVPYGSAFQVTSGHVMDWKPHATLMK
ncbi:hypothetical protein EC988_003132, partial [Linderina pennispora]